MKAKAAIMAEVRDWHIHRMSHVELDDLARMFNAKIRGWVHYYGRYYPTAIWRTFQGLNRRLVRWTRGKYKLYTLHDSFRQNQLTEVDGAVSGALQPNGKIVIAGFSNTGTLSGSALVVLRLNSDGAIDKTFGGTGTGSRLIANESNVDVSVQVKPSGKIIISGSEYYRYGDVHLQSSELWVQSLTPSGCLDTGLGINGLAKSPAIPGQAWAVGAVLESNGSIVVVGNQQDNGTSGDRPIAVGFNPNGSVDSSFGSDGIFSISQDDTALADLTSVVGVTLESDGKLLLLANAQQTARAASETQGYSVIRIATSGAIDKSFANGGIDTQFVSQLSNIVATGISFIPDGAGGKILVSLFASDPGASLICDNVPGVIGTNGSFRGFGNNILNAFDGNLSTFFDAPSATGGWVGVNLWEATALTAVSFAPRACYESRMVGGLIQASNSANFSTGVITLAKIAAKPLSGALTTLNFENTSKFRYYRFLGPKGGYCNISELNFLPNS